MAHVPSPEGSSALPPAGARHRLRRVAAVLAHVCGLTLHMKRYIEKSRAKEWALFYLSIKNHSANELLFGISNYSKYNVSKDFEKLKTLLLIQPNQRNQENLREIQLYLKKNRAFHSLPKEVQLQLCQTAIYQEFEAGSVLLRQGHVPLECYLILAGHLKVMSSNTSTNRNTNSEILNEFEDGDFIGETCLLTNANRPASFFCKTDVKVLVISKEDFYCILAQRVQEQYQETCSFLGHSAKTLEVLGSREGQNKIEPPIIPRMAKRKDRLSGSLFFTTLLQGRCRIIAQMNSVRSCVMKTGSSTRKNLHTFLPPKGTPTVTGRSLETSTVSPKTSFSAARKKTLDTKKPPLQVHPTLYNSARTCNYRMMKNFRQVEHSGSRRQGSSPATCFVEIRVLEQGDVFISEGVECIFIPKNLFLAEASPEFRRTAVELVCAYPTEEDIREYLVERQAWNEYKARLLAQQLKTGS